MTSEVGNKMLPEKRGNLRQLETKYITHRDKYLYIYKYYKCIRST